MLKLTIETGNAAFGDDAGTELARILRELADHLEDNQAPAREIGNRLYDHNGNRVGEWVWN